MHANTPAAAPDRQPILEMHAIGKRFGGAVALRDGQLVLWPGEVHALMGENGAGKSTLMRVLAGAIRADAGRIAIAGQALVIDGPQTALDAGVTLIYQEINLAPNLSVAENIFLGRELRRAGSLDRRTMCREADAVLARLNASFDARARVGALPIADQQLVEIARALHRRSRILVMDEPTAALSARETERLFGVIEDLRREGIAIVYISHRMDEVYRLSDRVTVMRDGAYVGTLTRAELSAERLVQMMVGRPLDRLFEKVSHCDYGRPRFEVQGLSDGKRIRPASFTVHAGEVLGIAGLVGAGRTELARLIFGADRAARGELVLDGQPLAIRNPRDAIAAGIAYLPEDRKALGLFLDLASDRNVGIAVAERDAHLLGWHDRRGESVLFERAREALNIRVARPALAARHLSGGNQQKLLIARWVATRPQVLILDEPTRGVDVGAKHDIYHLIGELAKLGVAVIMISSELPEIIGMCDRTLVMREGELVGELGGPAMTQEAIMALATGSAVLVEQAA